MSEPTEQEIQQALIYDKRFLAIAFIKSNAKLAEAVRVANKVIPDWCWADYPNLEELFDVLGVSPSKATHE